MPTKRTKRNLNSNLTNLESTRGFKIKRKIRTEKNRVYILEKPSGERVVVKKSIGSSKGVKVERTILRLLKSDSIPRLLGYDRKRMLLVKSFLSGKKQKTVSNQNIIIGAKLLAELHKIKLKKAGGIKSKRKEMDYLTYFEEQISILKKELKKVKRID